MKFQNSILINFVTDERRTDSCTDQAKAICPFNFSKVGGITSYIRGGHIWPPGASFEQTL